MSRRKGWDDLLREVPRPTLFLVHKNRLGARPPRKRSAPVAGKWIRNDETPPKAGFRVFGVRGRSLTVGAWGSFRAVRGLAVRGSGCGPCRVPVSPGRVRKPTAPSIALLSYGGELNPLAEGTQMRERVVFGVARCVVLPEENSRVPIDAHRLPAPRPCSACNRPL